jgi:chromatin remodeling complex protein RSC6
MTSSTLTVSDNIPLVDKKSKQKRQTVQQKLIRVEEELNRLTAQLKDPKEKKSFNNVMKQTKSLVTIASKSQKTKRVSNPEKPSGFDIKYVVLPEILEFMNLPPGTMVSRAELTSYVSSYVKRNGLQNPNNRTEILPDAAMMSWLVYNPETDGNLTYPNMQRRFPKCFTKEYQQNMH